MSTIDNAPADTAARRLGLRTVFVAGPFFKLVDPETGAMRPQDRERFELLIGYFEDSGCEVHNAHRRERWGEAFLEPDDFTKLDHDEIAASDVLVAVPGPPASLGTHIELGWASALGKPIVLLLEKDEDYALMVYGLRHITRTAIVETIGGRFDRAAFEDALSAVCAP
ncbi:nucleoside 2-deoxyribosyltransferase [Saccharothrix yanglingensis]|uniref:nucleoside 2-deoxyribosyltransferase n=1 Tax=Saccharothrix yanglingensis TaxID=659496 RepID=UPI0027D1F51E|nr:nucleoside 2-deoxyribosyltransferase [Saccharothrix yanglingensis]